MASQMTGYDVVTTVSFLSLICDTIACLGLPNAAGHARICQGLIQPHVSGWYSLTVDTASWYLRQWDALYYGGYLSPKAIKNRLCSRPLPVTTMQASTLLHHPNTDDKGYRKMYEQAMLILAKWTVYSMTTFIQRPNIPPKQSLQTGLQLTYVFWVQVDSVCFVCADSRQ